MERGFAAEESGDESVAVEVYLSLQGQIIEQLANGVGQRDNGCGD